MYKKYDMLEVYVYIDHHLFFHILPAVIETYFFFLSAGCIFQWASIFL